MKGITALVVEFTLVVGLVVGGDSTKEKEKLKCYQCAVEDSSLCTDEYLQPCPDNQAYDSCMTRISKTKSEGFLIQKTCALAPCTFRDPKQNTGLGLDDYCDRSKDEYDCISCCKESGCNRGGPAIYRQVETLLIGSMLVLIAVLKRTFME